VHPLRWIGRKLARYLSEPRDSAHVMTHHPERLAATLKKGDVLLIEGTSRFSTAIRYVTQSTWSHAALCIGDAPGGNGDPLAKHLVEADINEGVRLMPLGYYVNWHTRICRPVGLTDAEIDKLVRYATDRIGNQYDVRNVFDLARYLIRTPPVPDQYKRRLLSLGSGDPTRAICSSLIAAAFESVRYPVLPDIEIARAKGERGAHQEREILHIRDSSLYAPRDFDVSPYFRIVKPSLQDGFDPHALQWATEADPG
jgi:permuted papain-like amidase YaeF/Yiix C92 family enzyme